MPPVDLEASSAPPRSYGALLFALEDYAYGAHLRALYALDPSFDDRPCYIAPTKNERALDLFERVPEVALPPHVHAPAWSALELALRSLMADAPLLVLVRGEPVHGAVSYGYHASASYAVVRDAIAERMPVYELRALRESAARARVTMDTAARSEELQRIAAEASAEERERMLRWLRGAGDFDERWSALSPPALAAMIAGSFDRSQPADARVAAQLARSEAGVRAWIEAIAPNALEDDFAGAQAFLNDSIGPTALLRHCLLASGGQTRSGVWWWTAAQLRATATVRAVLRAEPDATAMVEALATMAKRAKTHAPVAVDLVRAVVSDNPLWKRMVKASL